MFQICYVKHSGNYFIRNFIQKSILRIIYLHDFWAGMPSFSMSEMKMNNRCKKFCFQNCESDQEKLHSLLSHPKEVEVVQLQLQKSNRGNHFTCKQESYFWDLRMYHSYSVFFTISLRGKKLQVFIRDQSLFLERILSFIFIPLHSMCVLLYI